MSTRNWRNEMTRAREFPRLVSAVHKKAGFFSGALKVHTNSPDMLDVEHRSHSFALDGTMSSMEREVGRVIEVVPMGGSMSVSPATRRILSVWLPRLLASAFAIGNVDGGTGSAVQAMSATLQPKGELSVPASLTLSAGASPFAAFTGNLAVSYRVRTTPSGTGSTGTITAEVSSDFSPAGGPSAAAGSLTYTCGSASLGAACSGTQTASTTTQTPVVTLPASACTGGGGSCSSSNPASVTISFSLTDSPVYPTGSYSASVIFRISLV
jgi:hypothetical protein